MSELVITRLEDCFDGSSIFEYSVNGKVCEELIFFLGNFGKLDYFPEFPRPYFRVRIDNGSEIRGVYGETSFRITYCRKCKEVYKLFFESVYEERFLNKN